ncbi:unnamed protein product [Penicillium camemberti]|uniref:Str. FM013 n=1 Tax=Penicillium camemberti (strain FM 013) TaxID=1429867 RepID=A0A0G4PVT2_PENC3|nr:unnamed protein product [Penicillium camemberti]
MPSRYSHLRPSYRLYQNNIRSDSGLALLWYASRRDELGVRNMLCKTLGFSDKGRSDVAITKLLLEYSAMADAVVFNKYALLLEAVRLN